jgi:hypothetical protein
MNRRWIDDVRAHAQATAKRFYQWRKKTAFPDARPENVGTSLRFARHLGEVERGTTIQRTTLGAEYAFDIVWARHGLPTFELADTLLTAFAHTTVENIPLQDIRLPFPAFLLKIPRSPVLSYTDASSTIIPVDMIRVACLEESVTPDGRRTTTLTDDPECPVAPAFWVIMANRNPSDIIAKTGSPLDLTTEEVDGATPDAALDDVDDPTVRALSLAWRIALNTCLYIHQRKQQNDAPVPKKKKRRPGVTYKLSAPSVLRLPSSMTRKAQHDGDSQWRVQRRFVVRGHWRNQACGPGRKDRRLTWIEPYWKGPTDGPQLPRDFFVESQEKR